MKNFIIISILSLAITQIAFAQWGNSIALSSNITTESIDISNFDRISVTDDFVAFIKFGDEEKIQIEANENLHDYIIVEKEGDELKIRTKSYSTNNKNGVDEKLVAHITAKKLTAISGDNDAEIRVLDKIEANSFNINLDDDATLKGEFKVRTLDVNMDDDAELEIEGSADKMELDADSDSMIDGYRLIVNDLDIHLDGDSESRLTVNGTLNVTTKGDSEFTYKGSATVARKRVTGDSDVQHIRD